MSAGRPSIQGVKTTRLGREIRRARRALQLTLEELSSRSGVKLSTIQAIETGAILDPSKDKIRALAQALEPETSLSVLQVLAWEDEPVLV